jgi:hypothetical protein
MICGPSVCQIPVTNGVLAIGERWRFSVCGKSQQDSWNDDLFGANIGANTGDHSGIYTGAVSDAENDTDTVLQVYE